MWDIVKIGALLAMVKYFLLDSMALGPEITSAGQVTAILCGVIIFCTIMGGLMLDGRGK